MRPAHRVRQEFVMETIGLVIFTVLGMALIAGLSVALYAALPKSALDFTSRHGRYAALGTRVRLGQPL
jgi:hypothetical protein